MRSVDVLEIVGRLENDGIRYWIDGGWGVDALLEEETRSHDDLDLVITRVQSGQAQAALSKLGCAHAREIVPDLPAQTDRWTFTPLCSILQEMGGNNSTAKLRRASDAGVRWPSRVGVALVSLLQRLRDNLDRMDTSGESSDHG